MIIGETVLIFYWARIPRGMKTLLNNSAILYAYSIVFEGIEEASRTLPERRFSDRMTSRPAHEEQIRA